MTRSLGSMDCEQYWNPATASGRSPLPRNEMARVKPSGRGLTKKLSESARNLDLMFSELQRTKAGEVAAINRGPRSASRYHLRSKSIPAKCDSLELCHIGQPFDC